MYSWYSEELVQHLDPSGRAQKWSDRIETGTFFGSVAVATYCMAAASGHAVLIPVLAMLYLLGNWAFGRGLSPAQWKATVVLTAFSVSTTVAASQEQSVWVGVGSLVAGTLLTRLVMHAYRESTLVAFHVGAALAGSATVAATGQGPLAGWVSLGAGIVTGWVFAYALQGRRAMSVLPVRLRRDQFTWTLPDPPTQIPLLLRARARQFEQAGIAERKIGARSREDAAIDMKKIGGAGERKTGLLLLGLKRRRWTRIVHDVAIPGATQGGNADHVVLARSGGWVLDSKQFGSSKDPGTVRRTNAGEIVHVTRGKSRDLGQTLRTVAWAVRGIRQEMQVPFRGLLVVHNADVEPGLSVVVPGRDASEADVTVDVIASRFLVAYLDMAVPVMTPWEVSAAHWGFQAKLVSATTGLSPQLVAPLGGGPVEVPAGRPARQEPESSGASRSLRAGVDHLVHKAFVSAVAGPASGARPKSRQRAPIEFEPEVEVLPADPSYPGEGPSDMVARRVQERWQQVEVSEPAAPDDVADELRGLRRGMRISRIGFTEDFSDVTSVDLVALSGPCQGLEGPFVWACTPEQWAVHEQTGRSVMASTFSLESVAIRPQEEIEGSG